MSSHTFKIDLNFIILSLFSVSRISRSKCQIIEGNLRCEELLNYLEKLDLEKCVWLSEDATGINAKIEYHPGTNQLVGLVLPTDPKTGMPIPYTFMANSAEEIKRHSTEEMSTLVYVVLTLPLKPGIPPFVLQVFGTNNKFTTANVLQRLQYTTRKLEKYVILSENSNKKEIRNHRDCNCSQVRDKSGRIFCGW